MGRTTLTPISVNDLDEGLRRHMIGIYRMMALGLLVTAVIAYAVASTPALVASIFGTPLKWVAMFAPLAFVLLLSSRIPRMRLASARIAFFSFAAVMGVSMASIFLVYTGTSIAQMFLIAAVMFGSVSFWGYTTGRDLSGWSTYLMMALIGVIAVSLINLFVVSNILQTIMSLVGIAVFTGLTAWNTQQAKVEYISNCHEYSEKLAVLSALSLYLNLINVFQFLLNLGGGRQT